MAISTHAVVDMDGGGRARGRAHGEALRDRVAGALDALQEDIARRTGRPPADHVRDFLAATSFLPAIQSHTADLLQEVRGIAEGAGADFELVLAHNLLDEEWWYSESVGQACSVLAIAPADGRPGLLAQNMDLPAWTDGTQVVLRVRDEDGASALLLSMAGMIGLTGVSSRGVGVCVNALGMLRHAADGLPVAFAMRGALAQPTRESAERFLAGARHASGQHFAIGDRSGVSGVECSAAGAVPSASGPRFWHTNHPLVSGDVDPQAALPTGTADSRVRQARLNERAPEVSSPKDCCELLADREAPLCKHTTPELPWLTFGSVVFELGPAVRSWFALGPPDSTEFVRHDLD